MGTSTKNKVVAGVQSVQRAIRILEALAVEPSGVSEVARKVDLPKSTVARLLATLEDAEAVERGTDGHRYRIGRVMRGIAGAGLNSLHLAALAQPHLQKLSRATGEAAGLGIPDGYHLHYIAQVESENPVQVRDWTGELVPMHLVPSGLVIMAQWPAELLEEYLTRPLQQSTERSVVDPGAIRDRVATIRAEGHAWVFEEFAEGLNSVAAPVLDQRNRVIGALHVHGPAYRFPADSRESIAVRVMSTAGSLSNAANG